MLCDWTNSGRYKGRISLNNQVAFIKPPIPKEKWHDKAD